jgi:hypothetical protein
MVQQVYFPTQEVCLFALGADIRVTGHLLPCAFTRLPFSDLFPDLQVLVVQRPDSGLLAGQFEFPSSIISSSSASAALAHQTVDAMLADTFAGCFFTPPILASASAAAAAAASYSHGSSVQRGSCGAYLHVFSHIRQHSHVQHVHLTANDARTVEAWAPIGFACSVRLTCTDTLVDDEDADIDAANEDDEDSNAPRSARSARAVNPGSSTSAATRSAALSHTASWVPWAELPNLGLTLSAQKIAELVVGRPLAKSSTRATVASTSDMFGGNAAAGVQTAPPARLAAASTGKSKAVPDAANGESKSKKSKTQVSSPAATASAFFGKCGV